MFGANRFGVFAESPLGLSYEVVTNSTTLTKGDLLQRSGGFLIAAANSGALEGLSDLTATYASNNQTVGKLKHPYYSADNDFTFEMDFDASAAITQADCGKHFVITGATGAQQVSATSGSSTVGQVTLEEVDPRADGSAVRAVFRFAFKASVTTASS